MGLDTKYRPRVYKDVVGQDGTVSILKDYVRSGASFHQSYILHGPTGTGKTTIGRILARSMLCHSPVDGEACDMCPSCLSILNNGTSDRLYEVDAATSGGKENITRITDDIKYGTVSGGQRLYIMDEAHCLSQASGNHILKAMEDAQPGTDNKSLVCIFCTTEPDKILLAVRSRCAPAFEIKQVPQEKLARRLSEICEKEGIEFDMGALVLISEATECHFRNAVKTLEAVSLTGKVTLENSYKYLGLDKSQVAIRVLSGIIDNVGDSLTAIDSISSVSPSTMYDELARMSMIAYRNSVSPIPLPSYISREAIENLGKKLGDDLIRCASKFSSKPNKPTFHMLMCDVASIHKESFQVHQNQPQVVNLKPVPSKLSTNTVDSSTVVTEPVMVDDVYVHPKAVNHREAIVAKKPDEPALKHSDFIRLVKMRHHELSGHIPSGGFDGGQQRPDDVGGS